MLRALAVAFAMTAAADEVRLPDVSTGQIGGKRAMMVWPVNSAQKPLPPEGCEAHLVPVEELERELLFPCGKWFLPAAGTYRVWLEKPGFSTAGYAMVKYEAEPFTGRGMAILLPIESAGRVALAQHVPLQQSMSFRLLQIRGPKNGVLLAAFDRRLSEAAARAGVQMGVGSVLAAIFDRKTNEAIAIARPLNVVARQTTLVAPAPPAKGTDVFVTLERPKVVKAGEDEVALALEVGRATRKPDLFMNTTNRVFAVWYGVEGKAARLRVDSSALRYSGADLVLRPTRVVTVRGRLTAR